jgi:hypothetical protein
MARSPKPAAVQRANTRTLTGAIPKGTILRVARTKNSAPEAHSSARCPTEAAPDGPLRGPPGKQRGAAKFGDWRAAFTSQVELSASGKEAYSTRSSLEDEEHVWQKNSRAGVGWAMAPARVVVSVRGNRLASAAGASNPVEARRVNHGVGRQIRTHLWEEARNSRVKDAALITLAKRICSRKAARSSARMVSASCSSADTARAQRSRIRSSIVEGAGTP